MKNRRKRIDLIIELIRNQCIGSQDELAGMLMQKGHNVTQATLSRDLKMLRTSKIPTSRGGYMYVLPDNESILEESERLSSPSIQPESRNGLLSIRLSGNIAVIKTRNGYASGLAYDIDMSGVKEIIGTIPGSDTILAVMRDGVDYEEAKSVFASIFSISPDKITI